MPWTFFWYLLGPCQMTYWIRLTTDFMQSSTAGISSLQILIYKLGISPGTVGTSPTPLNWDGTMLVVFYFQFHVCFGYLFQSLTFSNNKPSWGTAYHYTAPTREEFPVSQNPLAKNMAQNISLERSSNQVTSISICHLILLYFFIIVSWFYPTYLDSVIFYHYMISYLYIYFHWQ